MSGEIDRPSIGNRTLRWILSPSFLHAYSWLSSNLLVLEATLLVRFSQISRIQDDLLFQKMSKQSMLLAD